ncbi:PQQ-binding-like beta-propeller repeat protein [bacterium]|nr:PQQ-binding-like beta-propeller repeat protein [Planctomicrobium sp.]MDA7527409.1 PQQ-binding-like beta-propeller repeat protein [bacterium]
MLRTFLQCGLVCLLFQAMVFGESVEEDWHQWRGPEASGVSRTADPPTKWSEEENIRWKVAIDGRGTSTPIICNNKVFVLTAIDTGVKDTSIPDPKDQPKTNFFDIKRPNSQHDFVVICLDRKTGVELWRQVSTTKIPHEGAHQDNDFAPASPTTDGKRLYCWFGSAGIFCYDLNGQKIWERDLGQVKVGSSLGEGCSPVLYGDKLVIVRDHSGKSSIEALNKETGETVWRKERDEGNAWATPLIIEHSGRTQVITSASGFIRSYDLDNGEIIWKCSGLTGNATPCPVVDGDYVICMSGYQGYTAIAVPLNSTGDISGSEEIRWRADRGTPYIPSPILYDGLLYFNQSNQGILRSLDSMTGKLLFGPQRLDSLSNIYASPVGADGRIYFVGRNGKALVLNRSQQFDPIITNSLEDRFDASPALAGKQLFLRGAKYLYCIEEQKLISRESRQDIRKITTGEYSITQSWSQEQNFKRPYYVHVPKLNESGESSPRKLPVFLFLHGNGGNVKGAMRVFVKNRKALASRYVMVFAQGYRESWNIVSERSKADDVGFIEDIVRNLAKYENVDANNFSVMGASNGAALVNQLAIECRLPNIRNYISGVSPLSVWQFDGEHFKAKGEDNNYHKVSNPLTGKRLLNISGTDDKLVPYHGGPSKVIPAKEGKLAFVAAEESTFFWAKQMEYKGEQLTTPTSTHGNMEFFSYLNGDVVHCKVNNVGHGATHEISDELLLEFLKGGSQ